MQKNTRIQNPVSKVHIPSQKLQVFDDFHFSCFFSLPSFFCFGPCRTLLARWRHVLCDPVKIKIIAQMLGGALGAGVFYVGVEKNFGIALRGSPETSYMEYVLRNSTNSYVKGLPKIRPGKRRPSI